MTDSEQNRTTNSQISLFDGSSKFLIDKPIRLIELFAGIGSQAKALKNIGADFCHYKICEFDKYAVCSYNAIHGTDFKVSDITKITADDLEIVDTKTYCYIMTYSFPCTDLSKAGKQQGMAKGSGTRSGLLWEVERLLDECVELPQVLLMENVPDVVGSKNIKHFADWIIKLESLGYYNKWGILNLKDFGIPQNRERCFMVSILGDYFYEFPKGFPLKLRLKDMLEDKVDEHYYINDAQIERILSSKFNVTANSIYDEGGSLGPFAPGITKTREKRGCQMNRIVAELRTDEGIRLFGGGCIGTLRTTDSCGDKVVIEVEEPRCKLVEMLSNGVYAKMHEQSRRVYDTDGLSPTIHTMGGGGQEIKVAEIIEPTICAMRGRNPLNPTSRKCGEQTEQMLEIKNDGTSNTLTTVQKDNLVIEPTKFIRYTADGFHLARTDKKRSSIQGTHVTNADGNVHCMGTSHVPMTVEYVGNVNPSGNGMNGNVFSSEGLSPTITTNKGEGNKVLLPHFRVRKLVPLESFRLMGFSDEDFYKAKKALNDTFYGGKDRSSSQLYKQAGNSIGVPVLEGIFEVMI